METTKKWLRTTTNWHDDHEVMQNYLKATKNDQKVKQTATKGRHKTIKSDRNYNKVMQNYEIVKQNDCKVTQTNQTMVQNN